ncbi:MTRF1L release factor glutamine methyltransferase-like [Patiria miniata]|uniref:Peptide chain release factor N(5)-glutamine methyltransferase n=1 Tax=Patiria miniata TaxID=46514 RepID=A0A913ZTF9_PATMI|nr:MTRF1L release factor glutamine methyltransferase-like [Patiria miniata]
MAGPMKTSHKLFFPNFKRAILCIDFWTRSCSKSTFLNGQGYLRFEGGLSCCHGNASATKSMDCSVSKQTDSKNETLDIKIRNQPISRHFPWTSVRRTFSTSVTLQKDVEKCSASSNNFVETTPGPNGPTLFECNSPQAAVRWWSAVFSERGVPEAEVSAEFIVAHALGLKQLHELTSPVLARSLTQVELDIINRLCTKRMQRIPVQYIVGDWDFRDLTLEVRPPVFIPRPETEMLVDLILGHYSEDSKLHFLEIGCGSGAISLSLLSELLLARVTAVDCSEQAVQLTMENADRLGLQDRLTVHCAAVTSQLPKCLQGKSSSFDAIISNPPYIPTQDMEGLQPEIKLYEDAIALCGGPDGMDLIKDILRNTHLLLKPEGFIWLETDSRHPEAIQTWLDTNPGMGVELVGTYQDYHDRPRFTQLRYKNQPSQL